MSPAVEEVQTLLGECGIVELIVKIISVYTEPNLISEVMLLATSLLCGGNEKIQNLFLKCYFIQGCEEYLVKLYDLVLNGFNRI